MSTDVETTPVVQQYNPLALIQSAIDKGMDPDRLGKLMDLQERWESNRAAELFGQALTKFQAKCPTIHKGREVVSKDGKRMYGFAGFDDVMMTVQPLLTQCGICVSFTTEAAEGAMRGTCRVRVGTHYEDHDLTIPIPSGSPLVNDTQKFGMALSYLKRYLLCASLNIVVTDEDNDATGLIDVIDGQQLDQLTALISAKKVDMKRFLAWAEIDDITDMSKAFFPKAMNELKRKKVAQ